MNSSRRFPISFRRNFSRHSLRKQRVSILTPRDRYPKSREPCSQAVARIEKRMTDIAESTHTLHSRGTLLRVLGVGFGLAVTIGGTIGMGILRTPGEVAAQL